MRVSAFSNHDYFVANRDFDGCLAFVRGDGDSDNESGSVIYADSVFTLTPELGDRNAVSLEAAFAPGAYLRAVDGRIVIHASDRSCSFARSTTFKIVPGLGGNGGVALCAMCSGGIDGAQRLFWCFDGRGGLYVRTRNAIPSLETATFNIDECSEQAKLPVNRLYVDGALLHAHVNISNAVFYNLLVFFVSAEWDKRWKCKCSRCQTPRGRLSAVVTAR